MKRFFARHSKSSALLLTLAFHVALLIVATGFVAVKYLVEPPPEFHATRVHHDRPNIPIRFRPPQTTSARKPIKPIVEPRPAPITTIKPVDVNLPPVAMIGVPMNGFRDEASEGIPTDFDVDIDFVGSRAKGEKVCFIVHFGPATIGKTPYSRMTGYTLRKRLEEVVTKLPAYALFNVACYWARDTCAMSPNMMLATANNKQKVMDWMAPVNPLEGDYDHCFTWGDSSSGVESARSSWPTRVEGLPFYSPKWVYPYDVPAAVEKKYLGDRSFTHWGRAVAWSILTQKPDTIFVLTTNYIDGWGGGSKGEPTKMVAGYKKMMLDVYGPDKTRWPTINVVVLAPAGKDASGAETVLRSSFGPVTRAFKGDGSVIDDIAKFMNASEKKLLSTYAAEHGE